MSIKTYNIKLFSVLMILVTMFFICSAADDNDLDGTNVRLVQSGEIIDIRKQMVDEYERAEQLDKKVKVLKNAQKELEKLEKQIVLCPSPKKKSMKIEIEQTKRQIHLFKKTLQATKDQDKLIFNKVDLCLSSGYMDKALYQANKIVDPILSKKAKDKIEQRNKQNRILMQSLETPRGPREPRKKQSSGLTAVFTSPQQSLKVENKDLWQEGDGPVLLLPLQSLPSRSSSGLRSRSSSFVSPSNQKELLLTPSLPLRTPPKRASLITSSPAGRLLPLSPSALSSLSRRSSLSVQTSSSEQLRPPSALSRRSASPSSDSSSSSSSSRSPSPSSSLPLPSRSPLPVYKDPVNYYSNQSLQPLSAPLPVSDDKKDNLERDASIYAAISNNASSLSAGMAALGIAYCIFSMWHTSPAEKLKKLSMYFDYKNIDHQRKARDILRELDNYLQKNMADMSQEHQQIALALFEYIDFVKDSSLTKEMLSDIASSAMQIR